MVSLIKIPSFLKTFFFITTCLWNPNLQQLITLMDRISLFSFHCKINSYSILSIVYLNNKLFKFYIHLFFFFSLWFTNMLPLQNPKARPILNISMVHQINKQTTKILPRQIIFPWCLFFLATKPKPMSKVTKLIWFTGTKKQNKKKKTSIFFLRNVHYCSSIISYVYF